MMFSWQSNCHYNEFCRCIECRGWGVVRWCEGVMCVLCHRGVQLILAYSWARPAILVVGKGRGGMFLFLLFLPFHSCSSFFPVPLFHLFYYMYLFYLFFSLSLGDDTKWPTRVDMSLNSNTINQCIECHYKEGCLYKKEILLPYLY